MSAIAKHPSENERINKKIKIKTRKNLAEIASANGGVGPWGLGVNYQFPSPSIGGSEKGDK